MDGAGASGVGIAVIAGDTGASTPGALGANVVAGAGTGVTVAVGAGAGRDGADTTFGADGVSDETAAAAFAGVGFDLALRSDDGVTT